MLPENTVPSVSASDTVVWQQQRSVHPLLFAAFSPFLEIVEKLFRTGCQTPRETQMSISPPCSADARPRAFLSNIEAAEIGNLSIDYEKLAVISSSVAERMTPTPASVPFQPHTSSPEGVMRAPRKCAPGSECIQSCSNIDASAGGFRECVQKPLPNTVRPEDIDFE